MATEILFWVLKSALWALVFCFLSVVIKGRKNRKRAVGFFHPYTNDGGGGERVLWCAVKAIQEENPNLDCIFYTGDHDASPESLSGRAVDRFGVELLHPPQEWKLLWLFCAVAGDQTVGVFMYIIHHTVVVISVADVCIFDKFMHFFIFLFSFVVAPRKPFFCGSIWLSRCKVIYYTFFSWIYGIVGSCTHLAMVKSSWTQSHIEKIWRIPERTKRVYPPCDTSGLQVC
ncbi:hypothetical protein HHK36_017150 [Tetracentron sinense]|uniref:ALG11 mannosyltransferase N-terminal domain-containing protein n=1 Tax=Tetracentron sinense TaxID=13715 RepID=A0A835DFD0_TETSI|nr:hypothetical protein HHK36_017150 [Tetracentron sinense]